MVKSLSKMPKI